MNSGTVRLSNLTNSDKRMLMGKHSIERMNNFRVFEISNTINSPLHYTNSAARNNSEKFGRQFEGFF